MYNIVFQTFTPHGVKKNPSEGGEKRLLCLKIKKKLPAV
jgi:hypothetical protein